MDEDKEINAQYDDVPKEAFEDSINENINEVVNEEPIKKQEKKKKGFKGSAFSYIALALVCSLLGGFASYFVAPRLFAGAYPTSTPYQADSITINTNDDLSTVSAVAKKAMGSVVGITTVETQVVWPFNEQDVSGVGSGVIIDSNGYILTNSHVVADGNAKEITVLFENGEQVIGSVLWNDATLDLAIVKVNVNNLPVAELGDSDDLEVGEIAIAIGNPLGLEFERTVTSGIISGLNRSVTVENRVVIDNLIQTDASINPGNSGGPLLNGKGQVIGINTAKISSGEGLGFAIPINEVKAISQQVIEHGSYNTVYMGIKGVATEEYQSRLGVQLSTDKGIVVVEVESGSPAYKAGLQSGDIITKLGQVEVNNMSELKRALIKYQQNDKENLSIIRNTQEMVLEIEFSIAK
ncbi:trypsin-like serine protease [Tissierella creatinini]|nr:trypsin-like serine protease [Tissierella creatinini]TJX63592.1 trypsin-like serine protease [Soehngenia saccharolytica]